MLNIVVNNTMWKLFNGQFSSDVFILERERRIGYIANYKKLITGPWPSFHKDIIKEDPTWFEDYSSFFFFFFCCCGAWDQTNPWPEACNYLTTQLCLKSYKAENMGCPLHKYHLLPKTNAIVQWLKTVFFVLSAWMCHSACVHVWGQLHSSPYPMWVLGI